MFQILEEFLINISTMFQWSIRNLKYKDLSFVLLMHNDQKDLDMKHATEGSFMMVLSLFCVTSIPPV